MKNYKCLFFLILMTTSLIGQNTILWKVSHPDTDKTSYLLGTFHQLGNSFVDSIPEIKTALMNSELVIFESIGSKDALIEKMNQRECSDQIEDLFSKKDYQYLKEISSEWKVNLCKLTLAEIYLKLTQQIPIIKCNTVQPGDTWQHFDNYVKHMAVSNGKEIMGLESSKFQSEEINKIISSGNTKEDKKKIKGLLKIISSDESSDDLCQMVNDYRDFKLSDYSLDEECVAENSLTKRNVNWMKTLPETLMQKSSLVTVGLFHLMKECGLITQLREKGYIITPVELK